MRLEELSVWGDDYDTPDGTCIRDYIHVVDLAQGPSACTAESWKHKPGLMTHNLGTGQGYSVLDVINGFPKATGKRIPYRIVGRRPGDAPAVYADPSLPSGNWAGKQNTASGICAEMHGTGNARIRKGTEPAANG